MPPVYPARTPPTPGIPLRDGAHSGKLDDAGHGQLKRGGRHMARPRIVIIGAGFAGYHAARELCRIGLGRAEVLLVNPTDYFLYLPLLPEVAAGFIHSLR